MTITERVKSEILKRNKIFKDISETAYDFWGEHFELVYNYALDLADEYGADKEIVALGALLHDVTLVESTGDLNWAMVKGNHHVTGAKRAVEILKQCGYTDPTKIERVRQCVLNHRDFKSCKTVEEICIADADIISHFASPHQFFQDAYGNRKLTTESGREFLRKYYEKDFSELSPRAQQKFRPQYELFMQIQFNPNRKLI